MPTNIAVFEDNQHAGSIRRNDDNVWRENGHEVGIKYTLSGKIMSLHIRRVVFKKVALITKCVQVVESTNLQQQC